MKIKVNGEEKVINEAQSLSDLIHSLGFPETGNAIALNCSFVPRSSHASTTIKEGDEIEIVSPMQGG